MASTRPARVVLLVGAGHAHVEVLRSLAANPIPDVILIVVSRNRFTPYSGMLPGLVAGLYTFEEAHIDTRHLAEAAGAGFVEQAVVGLDLDGRRARCADGSVIAYDLLSLDIGATPSTGNVCGAADLVIPVKPIDGFLARFDQLLDRVLDGGVRRIALVGAGAGGVEMALAVDSRLRHALASTRRASASLSLQIVTSSRTMLPSFPTRFARRLGRIMEARGIAVLLNARVIAVEPGCLHVEGLPPVRADAVLWVTEAAAPSWLAETGLPLDSSGFIAVEAELNVCGWPGLFAVGDVAHFTPRDLPKAGVYAVRQGPVLAGNIRRFLAGRSLRPYKPQRDALVVMSTGDRHAVGTRNGVVIEGDWVWKGKDWLDRRWVRRYQRHP